MVKIPRKGETAVYVSIINNNLMPFFFSQTRSEEEEEELESFFTTESRDVDDLFYGLSLVLLGGALQELLFDFSTLSFFILSTVGGTFFFLNPLGV